VKAAPSTVMIQPLAVRKTAELKLKSITSLISISTLVADSV
jgi:hypothetical protein